VGELQRNKDQAADVWPAGCTMLHSGRPAPAGGDVFFRREGEGIVLDRRATAAWRKAEEVWRRVSSRVIARLKWTNSGSKDQKNLCDFYLLFMLQLPDLKSQFLECYKKYWIMSLKVTPWEILMPGWIRMFDPAESLWHETIGSHGFEERNLAGEKFL